jgi:hypothetical protein
MKEKLEAGIKEAVELANKHAEDSESLKLAAAEMRGRAQALQQTLNLLLAQEKEAESESESAADETGSEDK